MSEIVKQSQKTDVVKLNTRAFRAPRDTNKKGGWFAPAGNERAPAALQMIRNRARDLAQNNPHAYRAVSVLTSHAVGTGIRAAISGDEGFEQEYRTWANSFNADHENRQTLYGLQNLAVRAMIEAGDSLLIMRDVRTDRGLSLSLQLIDADQIAHHAAPKNPGNRVFAGVEVNRDNRVVGYHILPELDSLTPIFVNADDCVHLMEFLYPGQLRGIPRGSQALLRANSVDEFMHVALTRAKVEACLSAYIVSETTDFDDQNPDSEDDYFESEYLSPGMIGRLRPGEDIKSVQPPTSGGLRDYLKIGLQSVAVAYGCTYDQISQDLSDSKFSSHKAGKLEFNRSIDNLRAHTIIPAFRKIIDRFKINYEISTGRSVNAEISLTPPGRESIEPLKDAQAKRIELALGLKTWSQAVRETGRDPEEQLAELKRVADEFKAAGIALSFNADLGPIGSEDVSNDDE